MRRAKKETGTKGRRKEGERSDVSAVRCIERYTHRSDIIETETGSSHRKGMVGKVHHGPGVQRPELLFSGCC